MRTHWAAGQAACTLTGPGAEMLPVRCLEGFAGAELDQRPADNGGGGA